MRALIFLALVLPSLGQDDVWWPGGDCGRSKYIDAGQNRPSDSAVSSQIVGGITANPNEFPWMVSIQGDGTHFCGGTLISDRWILTTADCVVRVNTTQANVQVVVGSVLLNDPADTEVLHDIVWITKHEAFEDCPNCPTPFDFNIGLIKTALPVIITEEVRPACAPIRNEAYSGFELQIMGYGSVSAGGQLSNTLEYTSVSRLSDISCEQEYDRIGIDVNHMTFCAASTAGVDKDGCEWDAGSPIVYKRPDDRFVVLGGITYVRNSRNCAERAGLFMNATMDNFYDWVTTKIEKN